MFFPRNIRQSIDNTPLSRKIIGICLILIIIPVLTLGTVAYNSASQASFSDFEQLLTNQVKDARESTSMVYNVTEDQLDVDLNLMKNEIVQKGDPQIMNGKLVLVSGQNQHIINDNFEIVDTIQKLLGTTATIFQVKEGTAVRISTNLIGADGKRAVGTEISSKVYDIVVKQGKTYYGPATVLGKQYFTAYEPLKDKSGEIIGVIFVGIDVTSIIAKFKEQILSKKLGTNGYMYVLDSTGTSIIHPTREGKNDSNLDFIKKIITEKNGYFTYTYQGTEKVAAFIWLIDVSCG